MGLHGISRDPKEPQWDPLGPHGNGTRWSPGPLQRPVALLEQELVVFKESVVGVRAAVTDYDPREDEASRL